MILYDSISDSISYSMLDMFFGLKSGLNFVAPNPFANSRMSTVQTRVQSVELPVLFLVSPDVTRSHQGPLGEGLFNVIQFVNEVWPSTAVPVQGQVLILLRFTTQQMHKCTEAPGRVQPVARQRHRRVQHVFCTILFDCNILGTKSTLDQCESAKCP